MAAVGRERREQDREVLAEREEGVLAERVRFNRVQLRGQMELMVSAAAVAVQVVLTHLHLIKYLAGATAALA